VISVNTTELLLPVTARDRAGLLVSNLTRKDFRVFEDGVEQPLSDLSLRQVPVDVALIVDASSSVAGNLDDFRIARRALRPILRLTTVSVLSSLMTELSLFRVGPAVRCSCVGR
jgi:hypothetical protein